MKKLILTAGLAALLMGSASAAEPTTLTDKADKLDEVIFGEVQQGSFLERVSTMDEAVYGGTGEGEGLDGRVPICTGMSSATRARPSRRCPRG